MPNDIAVKRRQVIPFLHPKFECSFPVGDWPSSVFRRAVETPQTEQPIVDEEPLRFDETQHLRIMMCYAFQKLEDKTQFVA